MYLKSADSAVFMANGVFLENNSCIRYKNCEAVYVTVFPLSPALLPYTVKFVGQNVMPCGQLVTVISLSCDKFLAMFDKRYSYVFAPETCRPAPCDKCGIVSEFFECVKHGDMKKARSMMTGELSSSVDDVSLADFLGGYKAVIQDENFLSSSPDSFLLIDNDNAAHAHTFSLKNNLIDNITEN